ncbi:hypothetical protein GUJ93_ZPchr0011g28290 [Zizania palustris]|uniref:Uncharacterized protein n=1 Tax=Zizania palustris TaxID=103762 RepID=A0A8J5WE22_ZIZPA|nr:hypothetical protein GUJ93_ZPchr0011g28290 [Zizania palustris]
MERRTFRWPAPHSGWPYPAGPPRGPRLRTSPMLMARPAPPRAPALATALPVPQRAPALAGRSARACPASRPACACPACL